MAGIVSSFITSWTSTTSGYRYAGVKIITGPQGGVITRAGLFHDTTRTVRVYNASGSQVGSWSVSASGSIQWNWVNTLPVKLSPNSVYYVVVDVSSSGNAVFYRSYTLPRVTNEVTVEKSIMTNSTSNLESATYTTTVYGMPDIDIIYTRVVGTNAPTNIQRFQATCAGSVYNFEGLTVTQHGHCWATTSNPTINSSKTTLGAKSSEGTFTSTLTGLSRDTLYYVRAYATFSDGTTVYGNQQSFRTENGLAELTTSSVTNIHTEFADCPGSITDLNNAPKVLAYGHCWATTSNPTISNSKTNLGETSSTGTFTSRLNRLVPGTTYYVRSYAVTEHGTTYGSQVSFTTGNGMPVSSFITSWTSTISGYRYYGVKFTVQNNCVITRLGLYLDTARTVRIYNTSGTQLGSSSVSATGSWGWATLSSPIYLTPGSYYVVVDVSSTSNGAFYRTASLPRTTNNGVTIEYSVYSTSSSNLEAYISSTTVYGMPDIDVTFTPYLAINSFSNVKRYSATINGKIYNINKTAHGATIVEYGHCWSTSSNPTINSLRTTFTGTPTENGTVTSNMTNLSRATTYYVRGYIKDSNGVVTYGNERSFTTENGLIDLTTQSASNVYINTATLHGTITDFNDAPSALEYGFCIATTTNPTTANTKYNLGTTTSTGSFSKTIGGLTASTTYYVRAYAITEHGTTYGSQISFTTSSGNPIAQFITTWNSTSNGYRYVGVKFTTPNIPCTVTAFGLYNDTSRSVRIYNSSGSLVGSATTVSTTSTGWKYTTLSTPINLAANTTYYLTVDLGSSSNYHFYRSTTLPRESNGLTIECGFMTNSTSNLESYVSTGFVYGMPDMTITYTPTVSTSAASNISYTTARLNGNIPVIGGGVIDHGFVYSKTSGPTIENATKASKGAKSTGGTFYSDVSGLDRNTTYYVRAYITDETGTYYGSEVTFKTTAAGTPGVITGEVLSINPVNNTALISGTCTAINDANAEYGICWGTSRNPTTSNNKTVYTASGTTTITYGCWIGPLTRGTTYYARAYVKNYSTTVYGREVEVKTIGRMASIQNNGELQLRNQISERLPVVRNGLIGFYPFDGTVVAVENKFTRSNFKNFNNWSGEGTYRSGTTQDGTLFGNPVYKCAKGTNSTGYFYAYNISGMADLGEYVVFSCIMKCTNSTTSSLPTGSIFVGRGSPWSSGNHNPGVTLWSKKEHLFDGWWRLSVCQYVPNIMVAEAYKNNYYFGLTWTWSTAGTNVWATCPMVYSGTEFYPYIGDGIVNTNTSITHYDGLSVDEVSTNVVANPDGKIISNGTPGDYKPGWDNSLHPDAILVNGWSSGYNSGVGSPAVGYHARWVYGGIDGPTDPCIFFQDQNDRFGLGHRWLGVSRSLGTPASLGWAVGDVITVSWWQKSSVAGKGANVGIYHMRIAEGSYGFEDAIQTINVPSDKVGEWVRASFSFAITSNWKLDSGCSVYVYGNYGEYGCLWVDNVQVEKKPYSTGFVNGSRSANSVFTLPPDYVNFNEGTISCWFKPGKGFFSQSSWNRVFGHSTTANKNEIQVKRNNTGSNLVMSISNDAGSPQNSWSSCPSQNLTEGVWYHVVARWNISTGKMSLTVNGVKNEQNWTATYKPTVKGKFDVGFHSFTSRISDSQFKDLAFYNRSLTDDEVLKLYNSQFNLLKEGIVTTNNVVEKRPSMPSDIYYFPLGYHTMTEDRTIPNGGSCINPVYKDGSIWVGGTTTNLIANSRALNSYPTLGGTYVTSSDLIAISLENFSLKLTRTSSTTNTDGYYQVGSYSSMNGMAVNNTYTFSCEVFIPDGFDPASVGVGIFDYVGSTWSNTSVMASALGLKTGRWQRMYVTRTIQSSATAAMARVFHRNTQVGSYIYIRNLQLEAKAFPSNHVEGSIAATNVSFNFNKELGLNWSGNWSIMYWKCPFGSSNNSTTAAYNLESLGCNSNSVGGGYIWWGKNAGSNVIQSATPSSFDPNDYFGKWHPVILVKNGTTLTIKEYIGNQVYVRTVTVSTSAPNYYVNQYGYDFKLGGHDNANPSNSYYRDLIVAKRALTDVEINAILNNKIQVTKNELVVSNIIEGYHIY